MRNQYLMLELFAGSKVMAEHFRKLGFKIYTIDNNSKLEPDLVIDIMKLTPEKILDLFGKPHVVWASPPCTTFSVASLPYHWEKHKPKSEECKKAIEMIEYLMGLIEELEPVYWYVENPMGMMRTLTVMKKYRAYKNLVTYCQYGENRRKPTDIWTNASMKFRKACKNGDRCHPYTPRGSKTAGTQALKDNFERAKLPDDLCIEVSEACKKMLDEGRPEIPTLLDFQ